jgi:hypothetical protein
LWLILQPDREYLRIRSAEHWMQRMISHIFFPASCGFLYSSRASQTRIKNLVNTTLHMTKAGVVPPVNSTLTASFYFTLTLALCGMTTKSCTTPQKIGSFWSTFSHL